MQRFGTVWRRSSLPPRKRMKGAKLFDCEEYLSNSNLWAQAASKMLSQRLGWELTTGRFICKMDQMDRRLWSEDGEEIWSVKQRVKEVVIYWQTVADCNVFHQSFHSISCRRLEQISERKGHSMKNTIQRIRIGSSCVSCCCFSGWFVSDAGLSWFIVPSC